MKIPGLKLNKFQKNTLLGGIVGSLVYNAEQAASEIVVPYPPELSSTLSPGLPRNGTLLALGAPLVGAWVVAKYKPSATVDDMKNGITIYDAPKLVQQFVTSMCYQAGVDSVAGLRRAVAGLPIKVNNTVKAVNTAAVRYKPAGAVKPAGVGKYAPA